MAITRLGPNQLINLTSNVTGTLPVANGGTALTTGFVNGGVITEVDQWRVPGEVNEASDADVTSWERADDASATYVGTGMSESSGIFTFPSTGKWVIQASFYIIQSSDASATVRTSVTQNNSSYDDFGFANTNNSGNSTAPSICVVDVTDTANVKVKFRTTSFASGTKIYGETNNNYSVVLFMRVGDT
jgi:hypothetical protein